MKVNKTLIEKYIDKRIRDEERVNMLLGGVYVIGSIGFIAAIAAALFDFTIVLTF